MITENLSTLKIHKLTQDQYEREVIEDRIEANAFYLTPDAGHMGVTINEGKASHTAIEISNHVQTGGTVVLYDCNCNYFHLNRLSDREVFFSSTQGYSGQDIGYWIFDDGTVESRKIPTPTMVVTLDRENEMASHSFSEIKAHVENGGIVVAMDENNLVYRLSYFDDGNVTFTCIPDEAFIYFYTVDDAKACSFYEISLATVDNLPTTTLIVTVDENTGTASHSFGEIKAHSEDGAMVVARVDVSNDTYNHLYYLDHLDNTVGVARFTCVSGSALYLLDIGHDERYYLSDVKLLTSNDVINTVSKSSTNAVQSKAVYDYVQTAYKAVGTNLIAPITQRLDAASIDELITVEDIDAICGATITYVNLDEGAF